MIDAQKIGKARTYLPIALLVIACIPKLAGVELPIVDSFHIGEAFAAAITLIAKPGSSPLTIHGGWDFIPALVSRQIAGEEGYLYPTIYFTISILPVMAAVLFWCFLFRLFKDRQDLNATVFLSMAAILAPSLVGIRDVFLIISCWVLYELLFSRSQLDASKWSIALAMATSMGALWSFDRGIVATTTVLGTLLTATYLRHNTYYIAVICFSVLSILLLILLFRLSGTIDYLANVEFLFRTSSQWRHPLSIQRAMGSGLVILNLIFTIGATQRGRSSLSDPNFTPFWLGMSICSLLMVRIAVNRADMTHLHMAMWAPLLLTVYSAREEIRHNKPRRGITTGLLISVCASIVFALNPESYINFLAVIFASAMLWSKGLQQERYFEIFFTCLAIWTLFVSTITPLLSLASTIKRVVDGRLVTPVEYILKGVPYASIADAGNTWVAGAINDSGSECILDMTNSGIINAGTGKPTCTDFSYPVYATESYEEELLRQAKEAQAEIIVYSTENWQYRIDGKDMRTRFPRLDQYLRQAYPQEECREKYCIRSKESKD